MASSGDEGRVVVDLRSAAESTAAGAGGEEAHATPLHEIESLCMRCGENGITRLLLTLIPHFREVILMAFECPHCGERNNEIQFAGQLQPKGCSYRLEVPAGQSEILNRQVVKSESATIKIPELDFEIPSEAQRGTLSTVEGIIMRAVDELQALQDERKKVDPEKAEAIDQFLLKLRSLGSGEAAFTFILDDPAGNSFIENPHAPSSDPLLSVKFYERTREQQAALGFLAEPPTEQPGEAVLPATAVESNNAVLQRDPHGSVGAVAGRRAIAQGNPDEVAAALCRYSAPEEVDTLPSTCGACGTECVTRFFATKIPYFREVIVMATTCDMCGYRNSELKPGGEIPAKGKKITLHVQNAKDLTRDVIKLCRMKRGTKSNNRCPRFAIERHWCSSGLASPAVPRRRRPPAIPSPPRDAPPSPALPSVVRRPALRSPSPSPPRAATPRSVVLLQLPRALAPSRVLRRGEGTRLLLRLP